ncbi:MAG: ATP-dependent RecD-like DNA helicase [Clostridia bacterium]|nr:ATP-dependent RecD-like DNA helicase [Clostridia bacterium]
MSNNEMYEVCGPVERVVYRNEENEYTVIEVGCGDEVITAVGIMPLVHEGEELKLIGSFTSHATYGQQFSVSAFERSMPTSVIGILKYLSGGAVKGIGPSTAARLVKEFGENTLEIMENDPERVSRLKGISLEKAKSFSNQLKASSGIRELLAYLGAFGINAQDAIALWKKFGSETIHIIEDNPFSLCTDGSSINFETADMIAKKRDVAADSSVRIRAGLAYVLRHNRRGGHTCLPQDKLIKTTAGFLEVELVKVESALESMVTDGTLVRDYFSDREFIFLPDLYSSESYIAARMKMLLRYPVAPMSDAEELIVKVEKRTGIKYAELQKKAITEALCKGLLVLTGGPGTGKTTTLNGIINILKSKGQKVLLAAPTGRAAQRMSELTGCEAKTIHRLLEVQWNRDDQPEFKKNEMNMLNCDALIVDELSMVDTVLFESVLRALPLGCRIILVGDSDQLPSVGAGNVLADLVASETIPVVALKEIFRQSEQSLIVTNAHRIVKGIMPELAVKDNDFFFLSCTNQQAARELIVSLCSERLPKSYGFSPLSDIQVLTPGRKGILGTGELNQALREALNPPSKQKDEITFGFNTFRTGDKVMQVKNNYNISWLRESTGEFGEGIFNGDIGIIEQIDKVSRRMQIRFDDRSAIYDGDCVSDLELSYACTVHKSQGNEFDAVVMPVIKNSQYLFYRNLLYTGVTRAKKLLIIVGSKDSVEYMVNNNVRTLRYSGLRDMLVRE